MSQEITETTIEILGKVYHVNCLSSEVPALKEAALFLENKVYEMRQTSPTMNTESIILITALNMIHAKLLAEKEQNKQSHSIKQRLHDLQQIIDQAMRGNAQMEFLPAE